MLLEKNLNAVEINQLINKGWVAIQDYYASDITNALLNQAQSLVDQDAFRLAGIGKNLLEKTDQKIRTNGIYWVEDWDAYESHKRLAKIIQDLGSFLSAELRLSLKSFEGHYGYYSEGDFYKKHLDQHQQGKHRQVTFIYYLNQGFGGELVLYDRNNRNRIDQVIKPKKGLVVVFLSALIFHEVLPSFYDRLNFTGWFRDDENFFNDRLVLENR